MERVHSHGRGDEQEATPSTQSHLKFLLRHNGCHSCLCPLAQASPVATPCRTEAVGVCSSSRRPRAGRHGLLQGGRTCPERAPAPRPAGKYLTEQGRWEASSIVCGKQKDFAVVVVRIILSAATTVRHFLRPRPYIGSVGDARKTEE